MTEYYKKHLKTIFTIDFDNFGSAFLIGCLKDLAIQGKLEEPYKRSKGVSYRRTVKITFENDWAANNFEGALDKIFNPNLFDIVKTNDFLFKDEWEYFEYALSVMDWYYSFSDDYSVWSSGDRKLKEIKEMAKSLKSLDLGRFNAIIERVKTKDTEQFLNF